MHPQAQRLSRTCCCGTPIAKAQLRQHATAAARSPPHALQLPAPDAARREERAGLRTELPAQQQCTTTVWRTPPPRRSARACQQHFQCTLRSAAARGAPTASADTSGPQYATKGAAAQTQQDNATKKSSSWHRYGRARPSRACATGHRASRGQLHGACLRCTSATGGPPWAAATPSGRRPPARQRQPPAPPAPPAQPAPQQQRWQTWPPASS